MTEIFTELCAGVGDDLQRKGYAGKTIGIKLRYDNFATVSRVQTLAEPTQDSATIRRAAGGCLKRVSLERRIRLIGVRVGGLVRAGRRPRRYASRNADRATASLFDTLFDQPVIWFAAPFVAASTQASGRSRRLLRFRPAATPKQRELRRCREPRRVDE